MASLIVIADCLRCPDHPRKFFGTKELEKEGIEADDVQGNKEIFKRFSKRLQCGSCERKDKIRVSVFKLRGLNDTTLLFEGLGVVLTLGLVLFLIWLLP